MAIDSKAYLGTGWQFPPTFSHRAQTVQMVSDEEDIRESLAILLSTRRGERVMQPTYGCDLQILLFEELSPAITSKVEERIRTAIVFHESRIRLERIELSQDDFRQGIVNIELDYTILTTNSRFNMVYPFYAQEGIASV